ncbi:MAG TPA: hypothetical protein VES40_13010 [Ilumatobacteraceae bacterium]|nr:hypothetical protein [Ilumatobacteraceae bacterium]
MLRPTMGWDNSRPVPWKRLMREWLIYAVIMSAIFVIFFRGGNVVGAIAGVLISGPLYLGFGAVMAKFGYQRQRLKDVRAARGDAVDASTSSAVPAASRPKPAPTSRTAGGGSRPTSTTKRKR